MPRLAPPCLKVCCFKWTSATPTIRIYVKCQILTKICRLFCTEATDILHEDLRKFVIKLRRIWFIFMHYFVYLVIYIIIYFVHWSAYLVIYMIDLFIMHWFVYLHYLFICYALIRLSGYLCDLFTYSLICLFGYFHYLFTYFYVMICLFGYLYDLFVMHWFAYLVTYIIYLSVGSVIILNNSIEWWTGNNLEGSGRCLFQVLI